jgi:hypothetical protein
MEVSQVLNLADPPKDLESEEYINGSITDSDEIVLSIKLNSLERCFLASSKVDCGEVLSTVEML